jgi:hypothetical protein
MHSYMDRTTETTPKTLIFTRSMVVSYSFISKRVPRRRVNYEPFPSAGWNYSDWDNQRAHICEI